MEVRKGNIATLVKRFQMVTEADARVLEYGSTIVLDGADPDAASLAPPADIRTVAIAGDHSAVALKAALVQHLRGRGLAVHDLGTATSDPVDYPDTAAAAAIQVSRGEADAAIVLDGAGLGSTIAANKIAGARAAM